MRIKCDLNTNFCDFGVQIGCTVGLYVWGMEDGIHPITGFKILKEVDRREWSDIEIKPLARSVVREFVGNGVNIHPYWFEALK